ncbi:MAG: Maf family protein [Phycisphaerae bacterium]|nr:Maf family protein [Phycisphaerae bacterium]
MREDMTKTGGEGAGEVFLASRSPRRRQLLSEAGLPHRFGHPGVEDSELEPGRVSPAQWVAALAYLKARAGIEAQGGGDSFDVVIGADTACVKDGELIGTPADAAEAERIVRRLSRGRHEVVTGVAVLSPRTGRRELFVDRASVSVGDLSDDMVRDYIASGAWAGKAGAYNLSERIAGGWPIEYVGRADTIMGLPVGPLKQRLARLTATEAAA